MGNFELVLELWIAGSIRVLKIFISVVYFFHALFMIKTDQFLNSKVMEATAAYPSTGNPELNS